MTNKISYRDLQSQVIDFIRFPLIIGVLLGHNFLTKVYAGGEEIGTDAFLPAHHACVVLVNVLLRFLIPLFFFMSGFLFFLNIKKMDGRVYRNKLLSRAQTLLIPYLFWNMAAVIFYYVSVKSGIVNFELPRITQVSYWMESLWGKMSDTDPMAYPIAVQFWFIRDLMVAVLLTPVIYFFCKKTKIYGIILLGIIFLFNWRLPFADARGLSLECLCFFTAGAYWGINKRNILEDLDKIRKPVYIIYPLFVIADLLTAGHDVNIYIHNAEIIVSIMFWFTFSGFLMEKGKIRPIPFLLSSSFFVFAVHNPFLLPNIKKICYLILRPETDLVFTILLFAIVIIVAILAIGMYYVLHRFLPKFTAAITGGR